MIYSEIEIRLAEIKNHNGYYLPEKWISGYLMTTTHRSEENARKAAAKDGSIAFILCWSSEVGNPVFGLMITEETYYLRRAAKLASEGKDNTYALQCAKKAAEKNPC